MLVDSLALENRKIGMPRCILGQAGSWRGRGVGGCLVRATLHDGCPFRAQASTDACGGGGGGCCGCFRAERRRLRRRGSRAAFPERRDQPFAPKHPDARVVAQRMEAAHALASGRNVVVVASARSLVRLLPPAEANAQAPLSFHEGDDLADGVMPGVEEFGDLARALEERGYANTGELDGPGTFAVHGGVIDVYPGNLVYPVRIDFFGDEVDEIRRIVPSTGQTVATLKSVEVFSRRRVLLHPNSACACAQGD